MLHIIIAEIQARKLGLLLFFSISILAGFFVNIGVQDDMLPGLFYLMMQVALLAMLSYPFEYKLQDRRLLLLTTPHSPRAIMLSHLTVSLLMQGFFIFIAYSFIWIKGIYIDADDPRIVVTYSLLGIWISLLGNWGEKTNNTFAVIGIVAMLTLTLQLLEIPRHSLSLWTIYTLAILIALSKRLYILRTANTIQMQNHSKPIYKSNLKKDSEA